MTTFRIKRIYEPAETSDGYRVLVDRLWPRGVSKERADLDEWAKDIAPSTELRQWFGHDPAKFSEFIKRYDDELQRNPETASYISDWKKQQTVTLLYGARDEAHNEAVVLKSYIEHQNQNA